MDALTLIIFILPVALLLTAFAAHHNAQIAAQRLDELYRLRRELANAEFAARCAFGALERDPKLARGKELDDLGSRYGIVRGVGEPDAAYRTRVFAGQED